MGSGAEIIEAPYELGNPPGRDELVEAIHLEDPYRLDLVALSIARLGNPALDFGPSLKMLDDMGARVAAKRRTQSPIDALVSVVANEERFNGDPTPWENPENSFLDRVLERRSGLAISLAIVYIEVARRADIDVTACPMPGHYIIKLGDTLLDPADGGKVITKSDATDIIQRTQPTGAFMPVMLIPPNPYAVASRILNNLKACWLIRAEPQHQLLACDLLLAMLPNNPVELRERAKVLKSMGAYRAALNDIENVMEITTIPDKRDLVKAADSLRAQIAKLH